MNTTKEKKARGAANATTITSAQLAQFKISPRHYEYYIQKAESGKDEEETAWEKDQQKSKTNLALHTYFHSKEKFLDTYKCLKEAELPATDKLGRKTYRMKENRIYRDVTFPARHQDKIILPEYQYDLILSTCKDNYEHQHIRQYCQENEAGRWNQSDIRIDEKTGFSLQSFAHFLADNAVLFDFTVENSSSVYHYPKTLFKEAVNNYMVWNMEGFNKTNFVLFVIEKKAPFICQPFILDGQTLEKTKKENRMLLDILYWCKSKGVYPDYAQFNILQNLYYETACHQLNLKDTLDMLDKVYQTMDDDTPDPSTGIYNIEPPIWMK